MVVDLAAIEAYRGARVDHLPQARVTAAAAEPQTVALRVPDFRAATHIIVFNESGVGGQVDILDAAILVAAKTGR
jgi:hypothetical protein